MIIGFVCYDLGNEYPGQQICEKMSSQFNCFYLHFEDERRGYIKIKTGGKIIAASVIILINETVKRKHVKDRHLDIPAEANRDNHINFTALEEGEVDPRDISGGEFSRDNSTEKGKEQQLNIVAGNVRYKVKITPFISKDNQRYHISITYY